MSTPTTAQSTSHTPSSLSSSEQAALNATLTDILTTATAKRAHQQTASLTRAERGELDGAFRTQIGGRSLSDILGTLVPSELHLIEVFEKNTLPGLSANVRKYLEGAISEKRTTVLLEDWTGKMDTLEQEAGSVQSLQDITRIYDAMKAHLEFRKNIAIPTGAKEGKFVQLIDTMAQRRDTLQSTLDTALSQRFDTGLNALAHTLSQVLFSSQLASIYNDPVYTALLGIMENMSSGVQQKSQKELEAEISKRSSELRSKEELELEAKRKEQSGYIRSIKELIGRIDEAVKIQDTIDGVEKIEQGGIPVQIRNILPKIDSKNEQSDLIMTMEKIFERKKNLIRIGTTQGGYVDIGDGVKFKVYAPEPPKKLRWEIKTKPPKDGMIDIYFEAREVGKKHEDAEVQGRINPHGGVENGQTARQVYDMNYPLRVSESDFREMMKYVRKGPQGVYSALKYKKEYDEKDSITYANNEEENEAKHAKDYGYLARILAKLPKENHATRKRVPTLNSGAVIGPTTRAFIKEFSEIAEIQLASRGEGAGIIIGESDAGTGKNYKLEIYAALTNREIFEMSGNKTATRGDVLFTHEIGPDGTYRSSTELIKGIQTPGAIICIDEINAYPAEVAKLLNPLLTGARYINDPIRGKIYCHESVIICGFMNPQTYLGTNPLAQEMRSRARIIKDKYPDLDLPDGKGLSWEEGYIMARHAKKTPLHTINQDDFISDWLALNASQPRQVLPHQFSGSQEAQEEVVLIRRYLKLAHKMREAYRLAMEGKALDKQDFHYVFGLRESIQVIYEYERIHSNNSNSVLDFRRAIWSVFAPKLSMKGVEVEEEKEFLKKQIEDFIV